MSNFFKNKDYIYFSLALCLQVEANDDTEQNEVFDDKSHIVNSNCVQEVSVSHIVMCSYSVCVALCVLVCD